MQKTDLMELKKLLKKDKVTISRICTCYVTTGTETKDKQKFFKTANFLNLPDVEFHKYIDILKKIMSCKAGDTMQTLDLKDEDCHKALDSMRWSELKQEGVAEAFLDKFIESYDEMNGYAIFLFYSAYDIPARGTDKLKQDESDEVYNAIYGAVCPIDVPDPALSLFEIKDKEEYEFHSRVLDKIVGDPVIGFLYPDYNNKEVNDQKIAYGICNPKKPHNEIPTSLFGSYKTPTAAEQAKMLEETLAETLDNEETSKVAKVTKNILAKVNAVTEKIKEDKEMVKYEEDEDTDSEYGYDDSASEDTIEDNWEDSEDIPNDNPTTAAGAKKPSKKTLPKIVQEPVASLQDIKETIIESGVDESKAEQFVEAFKEKLPPKQDSIRVDKVSKKGKIKCEDIDISVPADRMDNVTVEVRNGKKYVIIELSNEYADVMVNGIVCK